MVSIIIPNYNHAVYLKERIDSVLEQTYQDFEVIILDDCSTDDSRSVIEKYRGNSKVSAIIYNEKNSGSLFKQWERGINAAQGAFIWIAESDDWAAPQFLERLVPLLEANSTVAFAYSNTVVVEEGNDAERLFSTIRNNNFKTDKWSKSYKNNGRAELKEVLLNWCTVNNASAVVFRKSALEDVKPFDIPFRYAGDWYCYIKLCNKYDLMYLNEPLNFYRHHANNASKKAHNSLLFVNEHFNLYNWVLRNVAGVTFEDIEEYFYRFTRHSLVKKVVGRKEHYSKMFKTNSRLFIKLLLYNAYKPVSNRLKKKTEL